MRRFRCAAGNTPVSGPLRSQPDEAQQCHYRGPHGTSDHGYAQHEPSKFSTWTFETDCPLSLDALQIAAPKLPVNIYRAKGIVYSSDAPERRAVLQVVGKRVGISLHDEWGERPRRTRIVTVRNPAGIEEQILRDRFEQCVDG